MMSAQNAGAILMLDDDVDIMSIFTTALERQGFHVGG
jgi:DNA-binding NtrC family response regulator